MEHNSLDQYEVPRDPELAEAFEAFIQQTHVPLDFHARVMARVQQRQTRGGLLGWWPKVWAWRMPLLVCGATVGVLLALTLHMWMPAIKGNNLEHSKGGTQVKEQLAVIPRPFGAVLEFLEPLKKQAEDRGIDLVTRLNKEGNIPDYYDKESLVIMGKTPAQFDGYVYVDYYSTDGMVGHLLPNEMERTNRLGSNGSLAVGQPNGPQPLFISAQPPGLELITVIASKTPLFSGLRNHEPAESYLNELRQALSKEGVQPNVTATFHFIRTNGKTSTPYQVVSGDTGDAPAGLTHQPPLPIVAVSPPPGGRQEEEPAQTPPVVASARSLPSHTILPTAFDLPSSAQLPAFTPSRLAETGPAPPMARRTALVIGNAAYAVGPLQNAGKDATDIAAMLRRLGFEVTLLRDVPLPEMEEAVKAFNIRLHQGGMGLFYFAGHGVQVDGENYLLPINARIARQQDVRYQALPMGRVLGAMEEAGNGLNILILDACRNTPFSRSWRSSQAGLAPPPTTARGMLIAYATAPGGRAADGTGGENGVYTKYLLQAMTVPGLSIEQVFKQVRYRVVAETRWKQTPWESSSLLGDFAFMPAQADIVPAGAPPYPSASSDPETVLWSMSERSSHPEDVLAFLQAYPESRFAPAARLRLQQLQQQSATASNVPSAPQPGPVTPSRAAGFSPSPAPSAPPQPSLERAVPSNVASGNAPREEIGRNNPMDRPSSPPSSEGYTLIRRIYCEDTESGVVKGSKDLIFTSFLSCEEAKKTLLVLEQQKGNCSFIDKGRESRQKANIWIGTPSCKIPS